MALISGFIAWIMETWTNEKEFPRPFHIGCFEGFWWGFVSMTTVGYGDKAPRSFAARIFSIFWILVGITVCSMFTAALSNKIDEAREVATQEIQGNQIAVLKYRRLFDDAMVVAAHGRREGR